MIDNQSLSLCFTRQLARGCYERGDVKTLKRL
jgi:hypothetical protein